MNNRCFLSTGRRPPSVRWSRGDVLAMALVVFVAMVVASLAGYLMGRYLISEKLKSGASGFRTGRSSRAHQPETQPAPLPPISLNNDGDLPSWAKEQEQPAAGRKDQQPPASSHRRREPAGRPSASAPSTPRRQRYTVQVGVFVRRGNSQQLVDDLANRGYQAQVRQKSQSGSRVHAVETGSFRSETDARRLAGELKRQGYRVMVVPK